MSFSDAHSEAARFCRGIPGLVLSNDFIISDVTRNFENMKGAYPHRPHPLNSNIPIEKSGLSFSLFLDKTSILFVERIPKIEVDAKITIHLQDDPKNIISVLFIKSNRPSPISLNFDEKRLTIRWKTKAPSGKSVTSNFTQKSDKLINNLKIKNPKKETYEDEVLNPFINYIEQYIEDIILSSIKPTSLSGMCPWMEFIGPVRIHNTSSHLIIAPERAVVKVGFCNPVETVIEADPDFPNPDDIPDHDVRSRIEAGIYIPRREFANIAFGNVKPALQITESDNSGIINWSVELSVGLSELGVGINTNIDIQDSIVGAIVDVHIGVRIFGNYNVRMWMVIGGAGSLPQLVPLSKGSFESDGRLKADVKVTADLKTRKVDCQLDITDTNLPIIFRSESEGRNAVTAVMAAIKEYLQDTGTGALQINDHVMRFGHWELIRVPISVQKFLNRGYNPVLEGYDNTSVLIGITDKG